MPTMKHAIEFAKRGWYVFPLADLDKKPRAGFKWRKRSSNDLDQIITWSKEFPACNWGLDCGKSGLCIVDIDNKKGKEGSASLFDLELDHGSLLETAFLEVTTPNNGIHYYFEGLTGSGTDRLGQGIDIKSFGGYVVIPGSKIDTGEYTYRDLPGTSGELPSWIKKLASESFKRDKNQTPATSLDQKAAIRRATDYLKNNAKLAIEGKGGDETTYKVGCQLRDRGISELKSLELMLHFWNDRCSPPWEFEDLAQKLTNVYSYAKSRPASNTAQADFDEIPEPTPHETPTTTGVMDTRSFTKVSFPEKKYFLDPWITSQSISMVFGGAGTGKTWFAMSVLKCIAMGEDLGPWKSVEKAPVLYLDAEMTGTDVQERIVQLGLDLAPPNMYHVYNDEYCTSIGHPKANIMSKKWRAHIKKILLDLGVRVWAIDNLSSLTPMGDENTKEDWNPINQWLLDLRYAGITSILLHHTNKAGDQRGTSARIDNINHSIKLVHPKGYQRSEGTKFDVDFQKARMNHADLKKVIDLQFRLVQSNGMSYFNIEKPDIASKFTVLRMVSEGMKNKDIADELGCSRANITKSVKRLQECGYLSSDRELTATGLMALTKGGNSAGEDFEIVNE